MKYLYIVIAMILFGCSDKTPMPEEVAENDVKIEIVEVAMVETPRIKVPKAKVKALKVALAKNEVFLDEVKVLKNIPKGTPSACVMWSDGCNVCTRQGRGKASCTTNPACHNKVFSCLQWQ